MIKGRIIRAPVAIVGGGLAGLHAASLLHEAGIEFILFEARDRLGGRILSANAQGLSSADGFDLGPSWFWPSVQPDMAELVDRLGLSSFPQSREGDFIFQRSVHEKPQRYRGVWRDPQSMRLAGGTAALIDELASQLSAKAVRLNNPVKRLTLREEAVDIGFLSEEGVDETATADQVILALPPRLLEATVAFAPSLGAHVAQQLRDTPTWMAPHAKFVALYDRPFWREAGLCGTAQSMVGPLFEVHDATSASGQAALFGFFGIPATQRAAIGRDSLIAASVAQLVQLFGPDASSPRATLLKDWAADPLTSTRHDHTAGDHPTVTAQPWLDGEWENRAALAGSETSRTQPGYLAGAVEAAQRAANTVIRRLTPSNRKEAAAC